MSMQTQGLVRAPSHQMTEATLVQQQQAQQQYDPAQFSSSPSAMHQQMAQQKANLMAQQRLAQDPQHIVPGNQLGPGAVQFPPGYLQAQMIRQRQAAAAANWAAQQERNVAVAHSGSQRLGSAILRLLNFSEQLNSFSDSGNLEAWKKFVDEFYVDPALCTQSLPANPELSYELPTPLLPAYFHQMHQDITKLNLTFHNAREYYMPPQNHVVECPKCTMCYYFQNATKIEILGKLKIVYTPGPPPNHLLKMESWEFIGEVWDEWICRMPPPPIEQNGQDEDEFEDSLLKKDSEGNVNEAEARKETEQEKSTGSDSRAAEDAEDDEDADHEDLFGRSPTDSNQVPSRPPSAQAQNKDKPNNRDRGDDDEKTKDPSKRARMVMESGVTARHLRFLEISDVLGQLSPLFGQKSPKETLSNLLQSLPKLQGSDKPTKKQIGQPANKSSKAASDKKSTQRETSNGDNSRAQTTSQKLQQIQSGRAMQQQAAQVLQKQAAQTLLQALPPPNFEFENSDDIHDEGQEDEHVLPDSDDLFKSNNSSESANNSANPVKMETMDEEVDASDPNVPGDLDLDLDLDVDVDESHDNGDLSFDVDDTFDLGDIDVVGSKRSGDESFGPVKRQRHDENEDA